VDIENQLEYEQEYIMHKLNRQLKDTLAKKEAIQKKMDSERLAKEELKTKIEEEEKLCQKTLQIKLDQIKKEKIEVETQKDQEIELAINKLSVILERLVSERKYIQSILAKIENSKKNWRKKSKKSRTF
jgi:coiled-coil domain-containing protein 6